LSKSINVVREIGDVLFHCVFFYQLESKDCNQ